MKSKSKLFLSFLIVLLTITSLSTSYAATINYVTGYNSFRLYYTSDYTQFQNGNNCGPTAVANVLAYYDTIRGVNLYSGEITQSVYNQICTDVKYTAQNGTSMLNLINRTKKFCV